MKAKELLNELASPDCPLPALGLLAGPLRLAVARGRGWRHALSWAPTPRRARSQLGPPLPLTFRLLVEQGN